jgi:ribosome-associated heat shock protein Hsp15
MEEEKQVRIDKFLWAVRLYKTRSIATDECKKGRILIKDVQVKPARFISANEIITVRKPPVIFTYRVIEPIENRVSAKLVNKFVEDLTPQEEKDKLDLRQPVAVIYRQKGTGRPTKKDRRLLDRLTDDFNED